MKYLEAVELINEIGAKYDVMSIRYNGMSVWPYLRLYLLDRIAVHSELKASGSIIRVVCRSLFAYNPLQLLRHHRVWLFTGCERRKRIGDKMIHRISGGISASIDDCLMIEKPDILRGHYPKKDIEERYIVSEAWLLLLFLIIRLCLTLMRPKIANEHIMQQLLEENHLDFDYRHYVRMLNAKRLSLLFLLNITRKPELAILECPYDAMGYMWALRQKGVKILEMQHGVAGAKHNAYNAQHYEKRMQPDGICVFGSEEYRYFTEEEPQYADRVYMTGLYMLEKADEYFCKDPFVAYRKQYKSVIVVSGQNGYEEQLSAWIDKVARLNKNLFFMYIPRLENATLSLSASNIKVAKNVNIYEFLKWADVHITISSTTCLEAQYFNTPTIFFDYDHRASSYYGTLLKNDNGCYYIVKPEDFSDVLLKVMRENFSYLEVFAHGHTDRVRMAVQEISRK